jgi:hypothetical protein
MGIKEALGAWVKANHPSTKSSQRHAVTPNKAQNNWDQLNDKLQKAYLSLDSLCWDLLLPGGRNCLVLVSGLFFFFFLF